MSNRPQPNRYDHHDFPAYVYREYPKVVEKEGKTHIVNSAREEREYLGEESKVVEPKIPTNDREALFDKLDEFKINYDKRWATEKLQKLVEDRQASNQQD